VSAQDVLNDPDHWRERAEETRLLAELLDTPDARASMEKIAAEYERMAALTEACAGRRS